MSNNNDFKSDFDQAIERLKTDLYSDNLIVVSRALKRLEIMYNDYRTNHILHLLLTISTFLVWIIVWYIISHNNTDKRYIIQRLFTRGA